MDESFQILNPSSKSPSFKVGRFSHADDFSQLRSFNYFILILIKNGSGELIADTSRYSFSEGSLMSFSLYQPFMISSELSCEGFFISFHPDFFCLHKHRSEVSCNGVLFNNLYESPVTKLAEDEVIQLSAIVTGLLSEMRRVSVDTEVLLSYLKILLINATRIKTDQRNSGDRSSDKLPDSLIALQTAVEANFRTMHNASAYADLLSYTQSALNKACKDHFNKTLIEIITDRVVLESKRELYLTTKSIKAIGHELGFTDEFHFSKYFKRNVNISPRKFRETVGVGKAVTK